MVLYFRDSGDSVRVWPSHWRGDQFEVFTRADFHNLAVACARLLIDLTDYELVEDNG